MSTQHLVHLLSEAIAPIKIAAHSCSQAARRADRNSKRELMDELAEDYIDLRRRIEAAIAEHLQGEEA